MRRKNPGIERKKVFIAIEMISNTKTARERGFGAKCAQIREYTGLSRVATDAALRALERHGLITVKYKCQWYIKSQPPINYCFSHGHVQLFGGRCIKCVNIDGKLQE